MWVPIFSHTIVVVSFPGMDFYEPLHFLKLCWKENYSVLPGSLRTTYYSIADSSLVPYVHVKFIIRTTITYVQDRDDDPVVCPCVARVEDAQAFHLNLLTYRIRVRILPIFIFSVGECAHPERNSCANEFSRLSEYYDQRTYGTRKILG